MNPTLYRVLWRLKHLLNRELFEIIRTTSLNEWRSREELSDLVWEKQKALVSHAYEHSDFYRKKYRSVGFEPGDLRDPEDNLPLTLLGEVLVSQSGSKYEIKNNIPRFIKNSNYSDNFGIQWKKFYKTQLDSYSNLEISEKRLSRCLGFSPSLLKNKLVLEAGSGAGRFTEILIKYKND